MRYLIMANIISHLKGRQYVDNMTAMKMNNGNLNKQNNMSENNNI